MERPHAMIIPFPTSGHVNPMLALAKLLHFRGFYITFVVAEFNRQRVLRSVGPDALNGLPDFRFETIPDGLLPSEVDAPPYDKLCDSMKRDWPARLRELAAELNDSDDVPIITCIIPMGLMNFVLDVSEELGIPSLSFWTTSACGFMGYFHLKELIERGYTPLKDESYLSNGYLDTPIDWIPGMKDIRLRDLASFVRTTDPNDYFLNYDKEEAAHSLKASGVIINTFEPMESQVVAALSAMFPRLYTIGPLHAMLSQTAGNHCSSIRLSLWGQDSRCREWLNAQKTASVVYANFGSIATMTAQQLAELAWGLADSNHPFMLITRPEMVVGDDDSHATATLSEEFIAKTKGRCLLASWCDQEEILSHTSIGCFVTHSGWNSTLESVCSGVPMICWPGFAEQHTNTRYICKEWRIGMEIDGDVRREQVARLVRELMGGERGEEMRTSVKEWKERAHRAITQGGSSYVDMERLAKDFTPESN